MTAQGLGAHGSLLSIRDLPSPNCDDRPAGTPIDTLILHYTGMQTGHAAIERLRDPHARVSCHYVVQEDGGVLRLVPETRRAWHAGVSFWRGHTGLNDRSIGIEIVNPGHDWGYRDFPALQMAAVCDLCLEVLGRHPIPPRNVVAHSDVAPDRKQDPGELFDWRGLAQNGVGLWPRAMDGDALAPGARPAPETIRAVLRRIGYGVALNGALDAELRTVLRAFQRHWRPEAVTGVPDAETVARMAGVLRLADADSASLVCPGTSGGGKAGGGKAGGGKSGGGKAADGGKAGDGESGDRTCAA